ncbi:MAG TPA: hypothetical protein VLH77_01435 [Gammaproteobacteria bacterium]|nr:hypothetical protein [Gammaproteobacteria bacterium]
MEFAKTLKVFTLSLLTSLLLVFPGHAFYMNFFRNTPLYYFTQQDSDMANAAVYKALTSAKDGQKIQWRNPATDAFGYALPSQTKGTCRNLEIFNSAKRLTSKTQYKFCKIKGEWKIVE